ncbi:hypothetical protein [Rhodobaculum claviforme]|nr:hypothetical protein [Rhodobaculum claviforme]
MGILAAALLVLVSLQGGTPQVERLSPPVPEDAEYARVFMLTMEHIGRQPDRAGTVTGTPEQFNGLFRILARSNDGLRLRTDLEDGAVRLRASVRVPGHDWVGWLNLTAVLPPSAATPEPTDLRIGALALPPGPTLRLIAWGLDQRFGPGTGAQALDMLSGLAVEGDAVTFGITMPAGSERLLSRNAISELYGRDMVSRARVVEEVTFLEQQVAAGRLQRSGSYADWLRVVIERAAEAGPDATADAVMAGFMALNYLCGSDHFVSVLLPPSGANDPPLPSARPGCGRADLRGRVDLRRHFTTAATIKLISSRNAAVTAGEAKELSDSIHSGFDFTDIAANNSGIRLAVLLDGATPADLRALAAGIASEDDLIIDLDGIPQIMGRSAFRMRFGELDSPEYLAVIDEIERRIDALPIHAHTVGTGREG